MNKSTDCIHPVNEGEELCFKAGVEQERKRILEIIENLEHHWTDKCSLCGEDLREKPIIVLGELKSAVSCSKEKQ